MAGVTDKGFIPKTFSQILTEIRQKASESLGEDFPTTPDSVFGQLSNIFSESHKNLWDLGQTIAATQNRDTAEGVYLDYLAGLIGLSRKKASGSVGNLLFTGIQGTIIPSMTVCKDTQGRNVLTSESLTLNKSLCYQTTFTVNTVQPNTRYTISVEEVNYHFTSGESPTSASIIEGLFNELSTGSTFSSEVIDETLKLTYGSFNNELTVSNSSNITLDSVGALVSSESAETGKLTFEKDTITSLVSSNVNVISVTNPSDFIKGRAVESDFELRIRMSNREQSTGTATLPAIEAALSEVTGVSGVLVVENNNLTYNNTSKILPKTYEVFVSGGDDNDIAEAIWRTKPATGRTQGTITKTVIDGNGDIQVVKFSRDTENFAWLRVRFNVNDEEVFPIDGEDLIRQAVVGHGVTMYKGEDLEPTKFFGAIYAVKGIYVVSVEVAVTTSATDEPTFQNGKIKVSEMENLSFDTDRVIVTI